MRRRVLTLGATPTATLYLPLMIMNTIFKVLFLRVNYQSQDTKGKEKKVKKVKNQKSIVPVPEGSMLHYGEQGSSVNYTYRVKL